MLNQRGWYRGKTPVPWGRVFFIIFFSSKELTVMDDKEVKLLKAMEQNNKISARTLAMMLNISEKEVEEMIKELEEKKVILGYLTLIDWEKTSNNGTVTAIIDVQVTPQRDVGFDVIAERICRFPEVKSVTLMSGVYDLSVIIEGASMKEVALFVAEKLATLENVQSTATHFVLKKYKKDGIIFNEDKKDRRLVISP
jgi:DNA-binding Lrp family transcriptional regulator